MNVIIFAGPSISNFKDFRKKYKNFLFFPPLKHADLISNVEYYEPDIVGIIDDYSGMLESVWHNEILYVIEKGIKVFGAGAIGAIRAAELNKFGMQGVGTVYKFYKSNQIASDVEVVSVFDEKNNFNRITIPLINIRFTLKSINIPKELSDKILSIAKNIYWKKRTKDKLLEELVKNNISKNIISNIFNNFIDIQLNDSFDLCKSINNYMKDSTRKKHKTPYIKKGNFFSIMYKRDRKVTNEKGKVSLDSIANYTLLKHPDIENIFFNSLNRKIVAFMANYLNIEVNEDDIQTEIKILCQKLDIKDLHEWLKKNDINEIEFNNIAKDYALCKKMQKWYIGTRKLRRVTSIINQELILRKEYEKYKNECIDMEDNISESDLKEIFEKFSLNKLIELRIMREEFPWSVHNATFALNEAFSKILFQLTLAKEKAFFDNINKKILKLFK